MLQWISALPDNVVNNIFTTINTLICGLIVAFFTSTFLKKKEERTRIAGVIVEKRINSEQDILHYLEQELFKMEMTIENSSKYDVGMVHLLEAYGLPDPYHVKSNMQGYFRTANNLISSFMAWKINMRSTNCGWIPRYVNIWHLC